METEYKNEQWLDIKDYEGYYQVSNYGRIKSLNRIVKNGNGYRNISERILKQTRPKDSAHYPSVILSKNGKTKNILVHRAVAEAFIPNKDKKKTQINHKDENKLNNNVNNLEWCTPAYNIIYNNRHIMVAKNTNHCKRWKSVFCEELQQEFRSIRSASVNTGDPEHGIKRMCEGLNTISVKFHWRYIYE